MPSRYRQIDHDPGLLASLGGKTVIVTGGAAGIGTATVKLCNSNGANVVMADLEHTRYAAKAVVADLAHPDKALFVPADILDWRQMRGVFEKTVERFGRVDVVVANAGTMESAMVLDLDDTEADGSPKEPREAYKVIDVNLKGTLNSKSSSRVNVQSNSHHVLTRKLRQNTALKLAMHYMNKTATPATPGSIVLIASTSGYFGSTGVSAYIASKHGVVGLLRAAQVEASKRGNIRVNGVAPAFTPTAITAEYSQRWKETGLESNTVEDVAGVVAQTAVDARLKGACVLVAGKYRREMEQTRAAFANDWIGEDLAGVLSSGAKFFEAIGGYPLPKRVNLGPIQHM
ncbi:short chain dehydrogenase/reductase [Fonsecaea pedrosoi]|nr:short chain dehydrogenase/reductase [Fonsecaea pedrosoi]